MKYTQEQVRKFFAAIESGNITKLDMAVEGLRSKGPIEYQQIKDQDGQTILHVAAKAGNIKIFQELAQRFDSELRASYPNHKDKDFRGLNDSEGQTILFSAVEGNKVDMIKILIKDYNLNPNELNDRSDNLLHVAARCGSCEAFRFLAGEYGLKKYISDTNQLRQTVFHAAIEHGQVDMVKMLIEDYGFKINSVNNRGQSMINMAVSSGHDDMVNFLKKSLVEELSAKLGDQRGEEEANRLSKLQGRRGTFASAASGKSGESNKSKPKVTFMEMPIQFDRQSGLSNYTLTDDKQPEYNDKRSQSSYSKKSDTPDQSQIVGELDLVELKFKRIITWAFLSIKTGVFFASPKKEELRVALIEEIRDQAQENPSLRKFLLAKEVDLGKEEQLGKRILKDALEDSGTTRAGCLYSTIHMGENKSLVKSAVDSFVKNLDIEGSKPIELANSERY